MKKIYAFMLIMTLLVCEGCGSGKNVPAGSSVSDDESAEDPVIEKQDDADIIPMNQFFKTPGDNLDIKIVGSKVYSTLEEAGVAEEELIFPCNEYALNENNKDYNNYLEIADYLTEDGELKNEHKLVVLDVTFSNTEGKGLGKEDEFLANDLELMGTETLNYYKLACFSEAGKVDGEQAYYFQLERGESLDARLGFLVLNEDTDHLIGYISVNPKDIIQFQVSE